MVGLAVLAGIAIYIAVFWFLVRALEQKWAKGLAILVALAIPFWDLPFGYYNYREHCANDGGLHLRQQFSPVTSILIDPSTGYTADQLLRRGFKIVEVNEASQKITRYVVEGNGIKSENTEKITSSVRIRTHRNQVLPWNVVRHDVVVSLVNGDNVLVTHSGFHWRGVWWQVVGAPMFGTGPFCHTRDTDAVLTALASGGRS